MARHSTRAVDAELRSLPEVGSLRSDQRERRQGTIDAAKALMYDVEYEKIQVRDVAEQAGVALGTLYRYFNSKDHLFACALQSWSESFGDRFDRTPDGPTIDRVKTIYRLAARAFEKQPRVYGVMIQVQSSKDPHAAAVYRAFNANQTQAFGRALESSRLSEAKRRDVLAVMGAVLDENLRSWQLGLKPVDAVYEAVDRAADLILGR